MHDAAQPARRSRTARLAVGTLIVLLPQLGLPTPARAQTDEAIGLSR
jgi:hypothetical protein